MEIGTHTQTEEGKGEKTIAWERAETAGQWDQGSDQKLAWKEKLQVKEAQELETGTESSKGRPRQEGEKNKQQKQSPPKKQEQKSPWRKDRICWLLEPGMEVNTSIPHMPNDTHASSLCF